MLNFFSLMSLFLITFKKIKNKIFRVTLFEPSNAMISPSPQVLHLISLPLHCLSYLCPFCISLIPSYLSHSMCFIWTVTVAINRSFYLQIISLQIHFCNAVARIIFPIQFWSRDSLVQKASDISHYIEYKVFSLVFIHSRNFYRESIMC